MQRVLVVNARAVREWDHVARDCVFDQVFFAQAEMMGVVEVLNARLAREKIHLIKDCVVDLLYFAQDVRKKMRAHVAIGCMNGQML